MSLPDTNPSFRPCPTCHGKGEVWAEAPWARWFDCADCNGTGLEDGNPGLPDANPSSSSADGDLAREPVKAYPKAIQTATRAKKNRRPKATAAKWAGIVAEKQGPCVMLGCGAPPPNDMHHAIPRDRGGPDIAENCVPICREHHQRIELRDPETCALFVESLWHEAQEPGPRGGVKDTYSWGIDTFGEGIWERVYGVRFEAA